MSNLREALQNLEEGSDWKNVFRKAQAEVLDLLRMASFARFLETSFFDLMVKGLELRDLVINDALLDEFRARCTSDIGWTAKNSKELGAQERFEGSSGNKEVIYLKTRLLIQAAPNDILRAVSSFSERLKFDKDLEAIQELASFGNSFRVVKLSALGKGNLRSLTNLVCPASPDYHSFSILTRDRDAIVGMLVERDKHGGHYCIVRSVPWEDDNGAASKRVKRVDVECSGFFIEPLRTGSGSMVTYLVHACLTGVPAVLLDKVKHKRYKVLTRLQRHMEKKI